MAVVPPTLSSAQLTRLAQLLDGPTGRELRREFAELRLPTGVESTKWRMLRESFELAQRRDGHGGSVLRFVKQALDPAHELASGSLAGLRTSVNEVLLLSGLRARHGSSCGSWPTRSWMPRAKTGLASDGAQLVDEVFTLKNNLPPLAFNSLQTASERSAHTGYAHFAHFARGVIAAFRNPTAHEAKIEFPLTEEDALDMLATISMVHRRLDDATITPAAPDYARLRSTGS